MKKGADSTGKGCGSCGFQR